VLVEETSEEDLLMVLEDSALARAREQFLNVVSTGVI
jgi:hypothetical protein